MPVIKTSKEQSTFVMVFGFASFFFLLKQGNLLVDGDSAHVTDAEIGSASVTSGVAAHEGHVSLSFHADNASVGFLQPPQLGL